MWRIFRTNPNHNRTHQLKDTSCEKRVRLPYNSTNCQSCPSTKRSTFLSRPAQTSLSAELDCVWILCRAAKPVLLYTQDANPFYARLRRDLRARNWHKPVIEQEKREKDERKPFYNDWWWSQIQRENENVCIKAFPYFYVECFFVWRNVGQ